MFQLTYGLYVLTARAKEQDNGCIINTVSQITAQPEQVMVAINKQNYTHDLLLENGFFNISILDEKAPFSLYQQLGFQSGREKDKMKGLSLERSENGIVYLKEYATAMLSGKIVHSIDLGSHTMFLATVEEKKMLSAYPPVSYTYYQQRIKPKPGQTGEGQQSSKKGYICEVCGYIYEGETLPDGYICPVCKHGPEAFVKLKG